MSLNSKDDLRMQGFSDTHYHRPHDPEVLVPAGAARPWPTREDGGWDLSEQEPMIARPSLRRRRTVLTMCVIAFTIGSLMIILSSPYSNEFLAPGPLHPSHAQLLSGNADRCSACHSGTSESTFGWIAHAFSGASNSQTQSSLCMECHKTTIDESFALNPHNVSPHKLAEKTSRFKNASFVSNLSMPPVDAEHQIACSACHREHKGPQDLKAMTDSQCQSCHQSNYHSFESDHPEFTSWPKATRQNIAFDHSTHSSKHFPGSNAVFNCNRCHLDDAWQNAKIQAPFEVACASCHEKKIVDSGIDGFAVLALPMLNMKAIEAQQLSVGSWPLAATGDFDGPMPPGMRLFLMADRDAKAILESKPASFEFADLDPENKQDVRDAVTLSWSIKRLVHELSLGGSSAIHRRLEESLDRTVEASELEGLLKGIDDHSFAATARRWFPKLSREIKSKFGESSLGASNVSDLPGQQWLGKVRAQEQLAVNPLKGLGATDSPGQSLNSGVVNTEPVIELETPRQPIKTPGQQLASPQNKAPAQVPVSHVNLESTNTIRTGWVRDDRSLRVFYRPSGHHDEFLKNWIDAVLATPNADSSVATNRLVESLTGPNSIGNCRYCHSLKRNEDQSLVMNWNANRRDGSIGQFTSFSHRPHLVQPDLQDCSHCHKMDASVSNRESFASLDRLDCKSNFHPIQKSTCSACHQKGLTDSSCTTCHNYHVGMPKNMSTNKD